MAIQAVKTEEKEIDFGQYFNVNLMTLSWMGLKVDLNNTQRRAVYRVLETLPAIVTIILGSVEGAFQILWIIEIKASDLELLLDILTDFISILTCLGKGFQVLVSIQMIRVLLKEILLLWKEHEIRQEYRKKLVKVARRVMIICKLYVYFVMVAIFCFSFPVYQNCLYQFLARHEENYTFDYSVRMFVVKYPFEINSWLNYLFIVSYEMWVLIGTSLHWVCCDVLFIQLTTHVALQLEVLHNDLGYLLDNETDEQVLKQNLIVYVNRHRKLLRTCELLEKTFSPVIFTIMTLSSLDLCVNLFQLNVLSSGLTYIQLIIHFILVFAILTEATVYCSFAETLTEKTGSIADAVYNCNWTDKSPQFKRCLHILMLKAQSPFYLTALGLFNIDLKRLAWIYKTSMSFYMMLEATS